MKLEGSLDAFSLPDIFQLLSFTKKTGGLHLAQRRCRRRRLLRRRAGHRRLGRQLPPAAGPAHRGQRRRRPTRLCRLPSRRSPRAKGVGVVTALLESGAVDADLLRQAAHDQAIDAIFDLLRWQDGDFAFVDGRGQPRRRRRRRRRSRRCSPTPRRAATTWETVSQVVPVAPGRCWPCRSSWPPSRPSAARSGRCWPWSTAGASVAELVDLTGSGQYAVVSTLAALVQRGLLEVREDAGDGEELDHVAVVLRRQALLAPLEAFTPVVVPAQPAVAPDVRSDPAGRRRTRPRRRAPPRSRRESTRARRRPRRRRRPARDRTATTSSTVPATAPRRRPGRGRDRPRHAPRPARAAAMLGGAHVPQDVVPPRPEPFLPKRQAEFDERRLRGGRPRDRPVVTGGAAVDDRRRRWLGDVVGATATAPDPEPPR